MTDQAAEQTSRFMQQADKFDQWLSRTATNSRDLGVATGLALAALLITIVSLVFWGFGNLSWLPPASKAVIELFDWINGFFQNFGTEMFGALATFVLLQGIVGAREKASDRQLQEEIASRIQDEFRRILQAQEIARLRAAQTPQERQPILDSMMETGLLEGANFQNVDMEKANLKKANLRGANLQGANLSVKQIVSSLSDIWTLWLAPTPDRLVARTHPTPAAHGRLPLGVGQGL